MDGSEIIITLHGSEIMQPVKVYNFTAISWQCVHYIKQEISYRWLRDPYYFTW